MFAPGTVINDCISKKDRRIILRLVERDDLTQLNDYINRISREDTFISYSGEVVSLEQEEKYLDQQLEHTANGNGFFVVAEYDGVIIGCSDVNRLDKRSKHVGRLNIGLLRGFRSEGIGSFLLDAVIELAKKIGLQMVELSVYSPNIHAQALYKKFGFREVGKIPNKILFHNELVDELIMVKDL